jgi:hypothetical protein
MESVVARVVGEVRKWSIAEFDRLFDSLKNGGAGALTTRGGPSTT